MGISLSDNSSSFLVRALEGACEVLPQAYRLLPLPHVELYAARTHGGVGITSLFAAQLRDPGDPFAVGALGAWAPLPDLLSQVRRRHRRPWASSA